MTIFLLYWLVCGAATLAWFRLCPPPDDECISDPDVTALFMALGEDQATTDRVADAIKTEASREAAGLTPFRMELVGVAISPIFLPIAIGWLCYCGVRDALRHRRLRRVGRTFREYRFEPVNSLYLAKWIQRAWNEHTPTLFQAGFTLLGDYRLKPEPIEVHDRFFLSDIGDMCAAVCCVLEQSSVSLTSVLEDATVVETTSVVNPRPERSVEPADRMDVLYQPNVPLLELVKQHRDRLQTVVRQREVGVVRINSDLFQKITIHAQQVHYQWRYRHKELDQPPPLPDFEQFGEMPLVS